MGKFKIRSKTGNNLRFLLRSCNNDFKLSFFPLLLNYSMQISGDSSLLRRIHPQILQNIDFLFYRNLNLTVLKFYLENFCCCKFKTRFLFCLLPLRKSHLLPGFRLSTEARVNSVSFLFVCLFVFLFSSG